MAHRKTSGFTWALDPGREALQKAGQLDFKTAAVRSAFPLLRHLQALMGFRLLIRCLAGRAAQEFLKDRPVSEAVNVQGSTNYKKYSMYKDDKTTHSRTQHGPSDMTVLPKTQGQARSPLAAAPRGPPPPRHPGA